MCGMGRFVQGDSALYFFSLFQEEDAAGSSKMGNKESAAEQFSSTATFVLIFK